MHVTPQSGKANVLVRHMMTEMGLELRRFEESYRTVYGGCWNGGGSPRPARGHIKMGIVLLYGAGSAPAHPADCPNTVHSTGFRTAER